MEMAMMTKSGMLKGIKAAVASIVLLGSAGQAHALADLKLDFNGGSEVTTTDAFVMGNAVSGGLSVTATASSFITAYSQGISLAAIDTTSLSAGSMVIRVTQTNLPTSTLAAAEQFFVASLNMLLSVGTPGATIDYNVYANSDNSEYGTTDLIASLSTSTVLSQSTGGTAFTNADSNGLYSLTQVVTVTHTGIGQTTFGAQVVTPEPAMIGLMGLGALLVLGGRRARNS
jgi:hypothetical protein